MTYLLLLPLPSSRRPPPSFQRPRAPARHAPAWTVANRSGFDADSSSSLGELSFLGHAEAEAGSGACRPPPPDPPARARAPIMAGVRPDGEDSSAALSSAALPPSKRQPGSCAAGWLSDGGRRPMLPGPARGAMHGAELPLRAAARAGRRPSPPSIRSGGQPYSPPPPSIRVGVHGLHWHLPASLRRCGSRSGPSSLPPAAASRSGGARKAPPAAPFLLRAAGAGCSASEEVRRMVACGSKEGGGARGGDGQLPLALPHLLLSMASAFFSPSPSALRGGRQHPPSLSRCEAVGGVIACGRYLCPIWGTAARLQS